MDFIIDINGELQNTINNIQDDSTTGVGTVIFNSEIHEIRRLYGYGDNLRRKSAPRNIFE